MTSNLWPLKKVRSPGIAVQSILLLVLVFLAFARWMPGGDALNPESGSRAWIEIAILTFAFLLMIFMWGPRTLLKGFKSPTFVIIIFFGIWAMTTSTWAQDPILAIGKSIELIMISFIGVTIAYQSAKSDASFIKIVLASLIILVVFLFFINFLVYRDFFPTRFFGTRPRFIMGFEHPNVTTMYFSSICLISAFIFFKRSHLFIRLLYGSLTLTSLGLIFMTDSRTTLLGVLISILLFAFLRIKSKHLRITLVLLGLLVVTLIGVGLTSGVFDHRVNAFLVNHPDFLTLNGRVNLWKAFFDNAEGLNLTGMGYFNSRFLYLGQLGQGWGYHLHNAYLEVFFTTGWVGTFILLLFYFSTFPLLKFINKFSLPLVYLVYLSIEGIMEGRLFIPGIPFLLACGLIYYHQLQILLSRNQVEQSLPELPASDHTTYEPV